MIFESAEYSSKAQQQILWLPALELLAEAPQRSPGLRRADLAVDVHRDRDLAVPQHLHGHPGVDVEGDEQRGACAPGGVHRDWANARLGAACLEVPVEVARLDRLPVAGADDEVRSLPGGSGGVAPLVLALAPFLERGGADLGQGQRGIGGLRLGLPAQQVPADALKLPGDPELTCVDVDLVPAQAERFAAARPRTRIST
jgi:hypothetical protein